MKRILTLILISAFFYVVGGPGIKQIKVDDNFFVITDTTTAAVQYRFPKSALYYKVSGSNVSFFNVFSPNSQIGQANYHLDSLVDGTNSTFANIDSLESWLRLNTGFNPAGSAATPTLDEVTSEGATTTNAISTGAISAPSIANPSGALAIVDDVDITGSLDVDDIRLNGNTINRSTTGALRVEGFDFDGLTATSAGSGLTFNANGGNLSLQSLGSSTGLVIQNTNGVRLESGGFLMKERSAGSTTLPAYGQFWVKDDTPNKPKFTDDAGTDFDLLTNNFTGDVDITGSLDVDQFSFNDQILNMSLSALVIAMGGTNEYFMDGNVFRPISNNGLIFGASGTRWNGAYLSTTLDLNEGAIKTVTTSTPSNPSTSSEANIYVKGGKLVIQYNDAGTVRYKYLDLTSTGVTWVHTTTAP